MAVLTALRTRLNQTLSKNKGICLIDRLWHIRKQLNQTPSSLFLFKLQSVPAINQ